MDTSLNKTKEKKMINKKKSRSETEINAVKAQIEVYVKEGMKWKNNIRNARVKLLTIFRDARLVHNFNDKDITKLANRLGYTKSTRSKINTIVSNEVLMNNLESLPSNWGTFYLLKNVSEDVLTRLINDNSITPDMTFKSLHELLIENGLIESKGNVVELVVGGIFKVNYDDSDLSEKQIEVIQTFKNGINALAQPVIDCGVQITSSSIDLEPLMTADNLEEVA